MKRHRATRALGHVMTAALLTTGSLSCKSKKSDTPTPSKASPETAAAEARPNQSIARPAPVEPPTLANAKAPPAALVAGPPFSVWIQTCPPANDCTFQLSFDQDMMLEATALNEAPVPAVRIDPATPGTWSWTNRRTLAFVARATDVAWGASYTITLPAITAANGMKSPPDMQRSVQLGYLQVTSKLGAHWSIARGQPRFVGAINGGTGEIGSGPVFFAYDQRVDVGWVKNKLTSTVDTSTVNVTVYRPTVEQLDQSYAGSLTPEYFVAVQAKDLPESSALKLGFPTWVNGEETVAPQELSVTRTFEVESITTFDPATWENLSNPLPEVVGVRIRFNRGFSYARLKDTLQIEPEPESMEVLGEWSAILLRLRLTRGAQYTITTSKDFTDILGNPLEDPIKVELVTRDYSATLDLPKDALLVEKGRARVDVRARNVGVLKPKIVRISDVENFIWALSDGQPASCSKYVGQRPLQPLPEVKTPDTLNEMHDVHFAVPRQGHYCLQVEAEARGNVSSGTLSKAVLIQSSDIGVTAKLAADKVLVWATRLGTPSPIAGAKVRLIEDNGMSIGTATTDANGVASIGIKEDVPALPLPSPLNVVVESGDDRAVLRLRNDRLAQPWQFGLAKESAAKLYAAVFTDRGAYRPKQTVHTKIIVAPIAGEKVETVDVTVTDPRGQRVRKEELALDAYGAADFKLDLKAAAEVGLYKIMVETGEGRGITKTFKVEEYRVPTFKVAVTGRDWILGQPAEAQITATYMHGGSMSGRNARWQLSREPFVFAPKAYPQYVFSLGNATSLAGQVSNGERTLDDRGEQKVRFTPDHPPAAGPMRYVLESSVTDIDRQTYAGRLARIVHPANFYVGVRAPERSVLEAGQRVEVPVVAVSPGGRPMPGVEARVRLERLDHHSTVRARGSHRTQTEVRVVEVPQDDCVVKTTASAVTCGFTPTKPGRYRIRAWGQDSAQRDVQTGFEFVVAGPGTAAWPRFDQDRIDIVADKASYTPGDAARLVIQSPYDSALGLLTLEREGVISQRLIRINKDTPAIEIPIDAAYAPNVFASVVLLRGRVHDKRDATGYETGAPGFKIGYAALKVEPAEKRLKVNVAANRRIMTPGSKTTVEVSVQTADERPAPAQVTLWVVDEAVLGLTSYRTPNPETALYAERGLGVQTSESRLELPHAKRSRREALFPGGDGELEDAPRFSDLAVPLRKLFKSTAYWNPRLNVGATGTATVTFDLPDNITTYRIMAVAVDQTMRIGVGENQVLVKRPLIVQPVLPRFVYPGDELTVQALAFNGTGDNATVQWASQLVGLDTTANSGPATMKVASGAQGTYSVPVRVTARDEVKIRFAAQMGEHQDAVEVSLPVLPAGTKRTYVVSKNIAGQGEVSLELPADRIGQSAKVEVVASTTSLTELKDAVGYLMEYPYGCIEQTTSTAYPLVVLKDLLPEMGIEVDMGKLKQYSEAGVKRILSFQTEGGGLSYWPGGTSPHAFATAFGLTALIAAKDRGYDVPTDKLDRMANFLLETLRQGTIQEEIPHGSIADGDSRALFVMTLGRMGRPQPAYVSQLWEARDKLTAFGLSFLGIAASELPGGSPLTEQILTAVEKRARVETQDAWFEGQRKGGYSFDSPLRTHASALLAYASGAPDNDLSNKLLSGLLKRRQGGLWGNTQENVFGIMGVHRLAARGDSGSAPPMTMVVGNRNFPTNEVERVSRRVRRLKITEEELGLTAGQAHALKVGLTGVQGPPVILNARVEYEVPLDEKRRAAVDNGFEISRIYETLDGQRVDVSNITLGELIKVRLNVVSRKKLNYVAIDDKLPAGLEPLNTALDTTEKVDMGPATELVRRSLGLLSYQEIRDHRVGFFVDEMPAGEYEYAYVARATTPGRFLRAPSRAEAMYEPTIYGTTFTDYVTVREADDAAGNTQRP